MASPELGSKQICPTCQAKFYDLNAMSNFVAKPLEVLGWDPHDRLVDYLLPLIAAQRKAAA